MNNFKNLLGSLFYSSRKSYDILQLLSTKKFKNKSHLIGFKNKSLDNMSIYLHSLVRLLSNFQYISLEAEESIGKDYKSKARDIDILFKYFNVLFQRIKDTINNIYMLNYYVDQAFYDNSNQYSDCLYVMEVGFSNIYFSANSANIMVYKIQNVMYNFIV